MENAIALTLLTLFTLAIISMSDKNTFKIFKK